MFTIAICLPVLTSILDQVAIRLFRNETAIKDEKLGGTYDAGKKAKGKKDLLTRCQIKKVTPQMIAYAAVHVSHIPDHSFLSLFLSHRHTLHFHL